jgi:uncharacterized protein YbbC (DUF1343 family)
LKNSPIVKPGVEVFLEENLYWVKGRRVGLVTNQTGVNSRSESTAGLFSDHPDIHLVALYSPEHGLNGTAQAGQSIPFKMDKKYNLPVFSLYGQSEIPDPKKPRDMDESMRDFDTQDKGKFLEKGMAEDIEVLVFDLQDVGTRIYTYIATMAYCMSFSARMGIDFIVLDRPNPINGLDLEGPVLVYPEYSSFVGLYPIPVRHGMTVAELALLFNDTYIAPKVNLKVIPMKGWERKMWFDETGLPWISPSPNMPTLATATVYPGQVFLEGTNISEGRGTSAPFETFGAPWLNDKVLAETLNRIGLPGVHFMDLTFKPTFSKFRGELCRGCLIKVLNRSVFRPLETTLNIIRTIQQEHPGLFHFFDDYFDKTMGTDRVRLSLEEGEAVTDILNRHHVETGMFKSVRTPYLLY